MPLRLIAASLVLVLLAGCASEADKHYATELCTFKERKDPAVVAYIDKRDQAYLGEPDDTVYKGITGEIASAIATPHDPVYKYEERRDCYNKAGDYYYSCTKKREVDLSRVEAVARALTEPKARSLALALCQRSADSIVIKKVGHALETMATHCVIQYSQYCPLTGLKAAKPKHKPRRIYWQ